MHELSLAYEVIELAQREALKNHVSRISEMEIEVGDLSGVEADAFQSALGLIVKDTLLENTSIQIKREAAQGKCFICNNWFEMKERMATCPVCQRFPTEISGGHSFRVISITAD